MFLARIFTLYPEIFPGPLSKGLYGKAMSENIWDLKWNDSYNYGEIWLPFEKSNCQ